MPFALFERLDNVGGSLLLSGSAVALRCVCIEHEEASVVGDSRERAFRHRLRAFEKVELQPGQTTTVTLQLAASDLSFVNHDDQWVLEPGDFRLFIADQQVIVQCE